MNGFLVLPVLGVSVTPLDVSSAPPSSINGGGCFSPCVAMESRRESVPPRFHLRRGGSGGLDGDLGGSGGGFSPPIMLRNCSKLTTRTVNIVFGSESQSTPPGSL